MIGALLRPVIVPAAAVTATTAGLPLTTLFPPAPTPEAGAANDATDLTAATPPLLEAVLVTASPCPGAALLDARPVPPTPPTNDAAAVAGRPVVVVVVAYVWPPAVR